MGLILLLLGAVLGLQGVNDRSNSDSALLELARKTGEAWASHDIGTLERLINDPYFSYQRDRPNVQSC
jgi:hypothetical protein